MSFLQEHPASSLRSHGSPALAKALSPVLAVIPWWVTIAGIWIGNRWLVQLQNTFQTPWEPILGGAVVLVVAALLWAALTAWSSVGTTVAGICTLLTGVAAGTTQVQTRVYDALAGVLPTGLDRALMGVLNPVTCLLLGAVLLAAGLGAAGARRIRG